MSERGRLLDHKGKKIYFIDYTNIKLEEDFIKAIHSTNSFREKVIEQGLKDLLMLVDVTNSYVYGQTVTEIKRAGKLTQPYVKKTAVVGITGAKKLLMELVNTFTRLDTKPFETIEEAKEWLIK